MCDECGRRFQEVEGVLDLLGEPPPPVARELRGLAKESGIDIDLLGFDAIKFLRLDSIETTACLMDASRGSRVQYYQQTASSYFEALARARLDSHMSVAEVGAERTFWNLRVIEDLCDESYARHKDPR